MSHKISTWTVNLVLHPLSGLIITLLLLYKLHCRPNFQLLKICFYYTSFPNEQGLYYQTHQMYMLKGRPLPASGALNEL